MKLISWNVNGIRACITKGFEDRFHELDADIFCLQETKCQQGQVKLDLPRILSVLGITPTAEATQEQLFLQRKNRCQ